MVPKRWRSRSSLHVGLVREQRALGQARVQLRQAGGACMPAGRAGGGPGRVERWAQGGIAGGCCVFFSALSCAATPDYRG